MNRAWIPAGALASVSVAGLIALGPLTDSMTTPVSFPANVPVTTNSQREGVVPVTYNRPDAVGNVQTAVLSRGGQANRLAPTTSPDTGQVNYTKVAPRTSAPSTSAPSTPSPTTTTTEEPKKVVKRQTSITATGETNPDSGFAGGSKGKSDLGEQAATPSSNGG